MGLRVLAFATAEAPTSLEGISHDYTSRDLVFLGLQAMIDPPRREAIEAVRLCQLAGIDVKMITGDHAATAAAIASEIGLKGRKHNGKLVAITGKELQQIDDKKLEEVAENTSVFARVSPDQKLRLVKALQARDRVVAMTGDGVNDAPSLKQADIGVAMGITGTDVSKEAADMILLDDNFATIVKAVKEGRRIYENIRKFILYVLSCNLAEILTIFFAPLLGMAIPLLPIHILWINLVTDGLPGLALVAEPAEQDIMNRTARHPKKICLPAN